MPLSETTVTRHRSLPTSPTAGPAQYRGKPPVILQPTLTLCPLWVTLSKPSQQRPSPPMTATLLPWAFSRAPQTSRIQTLLLVLPHPPCLLCGALCRAFRMLPYLPRLLFRASRRELRVLAHPLRLPYRALRVIPSLPRVTSVAPSIAPAVPGVPPPPASAVSSVLRVESSPAPPIPNVASASQPPAPVAPSVSSAPAPTLSNSTNTVPFPAPFGTCHPLGSANGSPPLAVHSSQPLLGPAPSAPPLLEFSSLVV